MARTTTRRSRCRLGPTAARLFALATFAGVGLVGCSKGGLEALIEDRARYAVEITNWTARDDGSVGVTLRVHGPVSTSLDRLTFELKRFGPEGRVLGSSWHTVDLADRRRGESVERRIQLDGIDAAVESLAVDLHAAPAADVLPRLVELEGAAR